jgi:hypothetical protein
MSNEASAALDRMAKNGIGGCLHVCYMTQVPLYNHQPPTRITIATHPLTLCAACATLLSACDAVMALKSITPGMYIV